MPKKKSGYVTGLQINFYLNQKLGPILEIPNIFIFLVSKQHLCGTVVSITGLTE